MFKQLLPLQKFQPLNSFVFNLKAGYKGNGYIIIDKRFKEYISTSNQP
jgi:hypothetical protein